MIIEPYSLLSQNRFSGVDPNDYMQDLSNLLNTFRRHTKCGSLWLRRKQDSLRCRYNFPFDFQDESVIDDVNGLYQYIL